MLRTFFIMASWIPIVWGQSSISSSTSITSSAASPTSTTVSSAVPATTSSAITPRLIFDRIETLVACDSAEVSWEVFGIRGELYEVSLFAIDSGAIASISAASTASSSISARSIAATSSPAPATTSTIPSTSSAGASTMLVGRAVHPRQSQDTSNVTITTDHAADEPYEFTVALPAGSYYMIATLNDPLRTTARSNLFTVIERDDTSCLPGAGGGSSSSSVSQTTTNAGVMQTPGAGSNEASSSSGPSGGAIAGIVIGVLGGLAIVGFLAFFCIKKRRRGQGGRGGFASREMGERGPDDRFSALPSASSEDGQYIPGTLPIAAGYRRDSDPDEKDVEPASGSNGGYPTQPYTETRPGLTTESPWSETTTTHQHHGDREILTSPEFPPALGDRRRQSGPPVEVERTLVPKTSMQGIIGKSPSNESSANHSRSSSSGGNLPPVSASGATAATAAAAAAGPGTSSGSGSGITTGVGRSTSTKRKPVPSLGPELRGELQRERERKMSSSSAPARKPSISGGGEARTSYILTADPLPSQP